MVLTSDRTASAAAVFTTNKTVAAPVVLSRSNLEESGGLISSKLSMMPVGLEKDTVPGDFADLLEFLSRSRQPHR